jgi:hypothetical protein
MRRHALGIIALLMIAAGVVLLWRIGPGENEWSMTASILLRAGFTMGAVWLALPQVTTLWTKTPRSLRLLLVYAMAALVTVVIRPRAILYVGPVLAALAALQFIGYLFTPLKPKPRKPQPKKPRPAQRAENDKPAGASRHPATTRSES